MPRRLGHTGEGVAVQRCFGRKDRVEAVVDPPGVLRISMPTLGVMDLQSTSGDQ